MMPTQLTLSTLSDLTVTSHGLSRCVTRGVTFDHITKLLEGAYELSHQPEWGPHRYKCESYDNLVVILDDLPEGINIRTAWWTGSRAHQTKRVNQQRVAQGYKGRLCDPKDTL